MPPSDPDAILQSGHSAPQNPVDGPESHDRLDDPSPAACFWSLLPTFHGQHRKFLRIALAAVLCLLTVEWLYLATERPDPLLIQRGDTFRSQFRIEVNSSSWIEWMQMEGIGPALAHRIVADRKVNGPFRTIDEVGRVPGIGPATLDRIRPWLTISYDLSEPQPAFVPSPESRSSSAAREC